MELKLILAELKNMEHAMDKNLETKIKELQERIDELMKTTAAYTAAQPAESEVAYTEDSRAGEYLDEYYDEEESIEEAVAGKGMKFTFILFYYE